MTNPIEKADIIAAAGGLTPLAAYLCISKQAVAAWRRVPAGRAIQVAEFTGIPRGLIRPDIYPGETAQAKGETK